MTEQIAELIEKRLHPAGAMVVIQARHLCMEMRGVGKVGLTTTTNAVRGVFEAGRERERFLALVAPQRSSSGLMPSSPRDV
jgi:GTP cyclohydrolase I